MVGCGGRSVRAVDPQNLEFLPKPQQIELSHRNIAEYA